MPLTPGQSAAASRLLVQTPAGQLLEDHKEKGETVMDAMEVLRTANLLTDKIVARRPEILKSVSYYRGQEGRLRFASDEFRELLKTRFDGLSDNWCQVVADVPIERLEYQGFRPYGERSASSWLERIWEKADGKRGLREGLLMMSIAKRSYCLVRPGGRFSFENPDSAAILTDHATGKTSAGLLIAQDDKTEYAQLLVPVGGQIGAVSLQRRKHGLAEGEAHIAPDAAGWNFAEQPWTPLPFDAVPLVELRNKCLLDRDPLSDIAGVMSVQDAINLIWAYSLNALDYLSLPARVVLNGEQPMEKVYDDDGNVVDERPMELKKLLQERILYVTGSEGLAASIAEWSAGSIDGFVKLNELAVARVAAQTRTPAHYLLATGSNTPATGYDLSEAGLVSKVEERMTYANPAIKEINRLIAIQDGQTELASAIESGKTLWASPEYRSEQQVVDALVKLRSMGFPLQYLVEKYGLEPHDVKRVMEMIAEEAADAQAAEMLKAA
jgi:hypothetical protein